MMLVERLTRTDRGLLRMGVYEMRFFFHSGISSTNQHENVSSLAVKERIRKIIAADILVLAHPAAIAVTKDLTGKLKAGDLIKEGAKLVGGVGGGKPDLAQGGGPDPSGLGKALERIGELAATALG